MKHLIQPNKWTCTVTSVAMILNITPGEVMRDIGHDGSEIVGSIPRGFHYDELMDFLCDRGYIAMEFEKNWEMINNAGEIVCLNKGKGFKRIRRIMTGKTGLVAGLTLESRQAHMCAWNGERILDPSGPTYIPEHSKDYNFEIMSFIWITKSNQENNSQNSS